MHAHTSGHKIYRQPVVGELTVDYQALQLPEDPELTVFIYTAAVGSPSPEALRLLAQLDVRRPGPT